MYSSLFPVYTERVGRVRGDEKVKATTGQRARLGKLVTRPVYVRVPNDHLAYQLPTGVRRIDSYERSGSHRLISPSTWQRRNPIYSWRAIAISSTLIAFSLELFYIMAVVHNGH
jgi:hypothetical protein